MPFPKAHVRLDWPLQWCKQLATSSSHPCDLFAIGDSHLRGFAKLLSSFNTHLSLLPCAQHQDLAQSIGLGIEGIMKYVQYFCFRFSCCQVASIDMATLRGGILLHFAPLSTKSLVVDLWILLQTSSMEKFLTLPKALDWIANLAKPPIPQDVGYFETFCRLYKGGINSYKLVCRRDVSTQSLHDMFGPSRGRSGFNYLECYDLEIRKDMY